MDPSKIVIRVPDGIPRSLVLRYVQRCSAGLRAEEHALKHLDYERLRVFGHQLSGTGAAYGIPVITELGASIESAAKEHNLTLVASQMAAMEAYLDRIEVVE